MKEETNQYSIKFRPHTWEDVFGQDAVVSSLRKRVLKNNFPKATLLVGPYGTGKTTIAEILAACMQSSLPDGNPNWDDPACKSILDETFDRDTQRLDGGQLSGKEDVVEFTSILRVRAMRDKQRVLIIEEADQLSKAALNALLKALEDKTSNAKFILLSMMDKGGLSDAIKSRCQVFNIKSLGVKDTMMALKRIMEKTGSWKDEKIPNDFRLKGLEVIANASEGSLRTAVQHLETCLIGEVYDPEKIEGMISTVDRMSTFKILEQLLAKSKDENLWRKIFDSDAMQLYNYMTMLLAEALLARETSFVYEERAEGYLTAFGKNPNTELLYYNLVLHPQMNKPFLRTTDLVGALVAYYEGFDFRDTVKRSVPQANVQNNVQERITLGSTEVPKVIQHAETIPTRTIPVRGQEVTF